MKPPCFVLGLLIFLFLAGCSSGHQAKTEPGETITADLVSGSGEPGGSGGDYVQTGVASWYGGGFHGRRTANGEVYDMHRLTAAHNTLPFNSIVEVENLENQRKTIVRINDRGPFVKKRVIDLSLKAARILDMEDKGTARVRIRLLKPPEISGLHEVQPPEAGYSLQAGAFVSRLNAYNLMQQLNEIAKDIKFEIQMKDGYHKVVSERVSSLERAEHLQRSLEAYGFELFIRVLY